MRVNIGVYARLFVVPLAQFVMPCWVSSARRPIYCVLWHARPLARRISRALLVVKRPLVFGEVFFRSFADLTVGVIVVGDGIYMVRIYF